jgi:hypothetical protein
VADVAAPDAVRAVRPVAVQAAARRAAAVPRVAERADAAAQAPDRAVERAAVVPRRVAAARAAAAAACRAVDPAALVDPAAPAVVAR